MVGPGDRVPRARAAPRRASHAGRLQPRHDPQDDPLHARLRVRAAPRRALAPGREPRREGRARRSEEHTSELQSLAYLVCRLLLEKKKKKIGVDMVIRNRVKGS